MTVKDRFAEWSKSLKQAGDRNTKEANMSNETNTAQMEHEEQQHDHTAHIDIDAGTEANAGDGSELDQVSAERDQLAQQLVQSQDRLARLQAEFDNARKREIKERQDARDYAIQSAVEPFLGVMDNFALALQADGDVTQLRSGVQLIVKQMEEALRSLNVQAVESVGSQFDPRIHEALGSIETLEHPDHQVLEEIRRGYKLRDKLLRPALVRIATNSAQTSE
jgi:molecular chaperone GrpE